MGRSAPKAAKGREARREVLNLSQYVTYYFTVLANKLSSGASRLYLKHFGIGIIEWRCMAMLAIEPDIPPARICQVIGIDKSAVSREMHKLRDKGYLTIEDDPTSQRKKSLRLTKSGYALHDQIVQVALERERRLLSDLSAAEVATLVDLLDRTTRQIPYVNRFEPGDEIPKVIGRRMNSILK